jgi:rhodanese-related sulfurtransferase
MYSLLLAAALAAGPQHAPAPSTAAVPALDSEDLAAWMEKDPNLLVFDFRAQPAYEDGHVPFAVNLPLAGGARAKAEAKLEQMLAGAPRRVVLYGADAMTLSELAVKAAGVNAGPVAVYPGGVEGWSESDGGFLEIEWPGFYRALTLDSPVVLDVREAGEYAAGHIPGARHFNAPVTGKSLAEKPWSELKSSPRAIITYCSGDLCGESRRLAALIKKAGAKQVFQFPGGYPEWEERSRCLR